MTNEEVRESTDCVDFMYKIDERNNTIKFIFSDGIVKTANLGALKEIWDAQSEFKKRAEVVISQLRADRDRLEEAHRWVPVSERLPEEDGDYLTTIKGIGFDYNEIRSFSKNLYEVDESEFCDKEGPGWYYFDHEYGDIEETDVIAWMPLPKPYTAESEG